MRAFLLPALFALLGPGRPFAQETGRVLQPAEMQEDLFLLTEKLTSLHAGLHRYASAGEMEHALDDLALALGERPRDALWFYREISALVARIRCGHSRVRLGERDRGAALAARGLLPCEVFLSGERAWIRRSYEEANGLEAGAELLALDGLSVAEIRKRAFARLSDDGFIESGKERELEHDFAEQFALLVGEGRGEYELSLAGVAGPVRVRGLAPQVFAERRGPEPERPLVHLELRPAENVGLLSIGAFGDPGVGEPPFLAQLEQSFRTLREQKVAHLVLDLRGNGGGRDDYGARLVSYLSPRPFGYFERIEVTPDYTGQVELAERDGRRLMLSHPDLAVQQPSELRFEGDVSLLVDGFTFSTAADVATVVHANHLATFFGEETGGGYEGNNSGDMRRITLANSGLTVNVPQWNYTTAGVGPGHHGRGVEPDVPVRATIAERLAGRDVVLERALVQLRAPSRR